MHNMPIESSDRGIENPQPVANSEAPDRTNGQQVNSNHDHNITQDHQTRTEIVSTSSESQALGSNDPGNNPRPRQRAQSQQLQHNSLAARRNSVSPSLRLTVISNMASTHSRHPQVELKLNNRFMLLPITDQVRELQTVIRDKETIRGNFKFFADRLIRLVVEEGLNQLPIEEVDVETPTGNFFHGIRYLKGNCGVSIVRSGESMEQGLRDCCRSIRIGKILIESDENNQARVLYTKFPKDIAERKILLLYPIMSTGLAVIESVKVLLNCGVKEENLILLNLFSSPRAARLINQNFSKMFVLTSDINSVCPNHFGHRYFGTD